MEPIKAENVPGLVSQESETAQDFIKNQEQLEADAREVLPYQFDTCTKDLGPLRQQVFSCLTCNPPPEDATAPFTPAGVCYSCSISCHGEHELVELFTRRNFVCDCGTSRYPQTSPCSLRAGGNGTKGVHSEEPAAINSYNQNFRNRFCGCAELYDPTKERGTMYQCLGLGTVEEGGCGEDWWHPECLMGLPRDWRKKMQANGHAPSDDHKKDDKPAQDGEEIEEEEDENPPGFPEEDDFDALICYRCAAAFPWIRQYAGSQGFLPALEYIENRPLPAATSNQEHTEGVATNRAEASTSLKRKAEDDDDSAAAAADSSATTFKKPKPDHSAESTTDSAPATTTSGPSTTDPASATTTAAHAAKHTLLAPAPPAHPPTTLFLTETFRDQLCRCASCFPVLARHPHLLEPETSYSPPLSRTSSPANDSAPHVPGRAGSAGSSRSLLDRGEAALSGMDRVRALEGVMAYNALRDSVKGFLRPFADSGTPVSAEDIKAHFERLRGDSDAIMAARRGQDGGGADGEGDSRREQSGY